MSNKFLPFIVEKSEPLQVYQTLLSRSKGMNFITVSTVLYIVLDRGITEVRKFVKTLPELQLEKLYEEIIQHYQTHQILVDVMNRYISLAKYFPSSTNEAWSDKFQEYEVKDIMIFMLVLSHISATAVEKYTSLDFTSVINHHKAIMENLPNYITFSNTGEPNEFAGAADLEAFILYNVLMNRGKLAPAIKATFKKQRG